MKYDFGGWATRNDLQCADGRVIKKDAFKGQVERHHLGAGKGAENGADAPDDLAVADRQVNARHGLARGAVKADVQIMDLDHGGISFLKISSRRAAGPRRSGSRRGSAAQ